VTGGEGRHGGSRVFRLIQGFGAAEMWYVCVFIIVLEAAKGVEGMLAYPSGLAVKR
jgi:hypothetical protein